MLENCVGDIDDLLAARFGELPENCGNDTQPGTDEVEEWRDWTAIETTPDQRRIENFINRYDLRDASLLHIGVGNSEFAKRFATRAKLIVGTTISLAELKNGERLGLANYRVFLNNKYSGIPIPGLDLFDFIIDNNPTTFGCCRNHLVKMMDQYSRRLKHTGMIVTDRVGLGWVVSTPGSHPRWSFSYDDWEFLAKAFNLQSFKVDKNIYVLSKQITAASLSARRRPIGTLFKKILGILPSRGATE